VVHVAGEAQRRLRRLAAAVSCRSQRRSGHLAFQLGSVASTSRMEEQTEEHQM